jgi:hypothetical protein
MQRELNIAWEAGELQHDNGCFGSSKRLMANDKPWLFDLRVVAIASEVKIGDVLPSSRWGEG